MTDLFRKLNVLLRAGVNDLLSGERGSRVTRPTLPPDRLGANIDKEISALRTRVDDALAYEDKMQAQIEQLDRDLQRMNQEADAAVERGADEEARALIEKIQRGDSRLVRLQQDLRDHRTAAGELIDRVNQMEVWVAEAKQQAPAESDVDIPPVSRPVSPPIEAKPIEQPVDPPIQTSVPESTASAPAPIPSQMPKLDQVLRDAQSTIDSMQDLLQDKLKEAAQVGEMPTGDDSAPPAEPQTIEDDLERRRQRLSKRD